jgi:hypothetical protein
MTNLTVQPYVNTLTMMTLGMATVYNRITDPWVISGIINSGNTDITDKDLYEGLGATRMDRAGARKRATRTGFEPSNGRTMTTQSTCTAPGYEYHSCDPDDNTSGQKLDVRKMNDMLLSQIPQSSQYYFMGAVAAAASEVYLFSMADRLALVFGSMNVKTDGDGTSGAGTPTDFDTDCPHAAATQVVDLNAYSSTTTLADQGMQLHNELLAASKPLNDYSKYQMPTFIIPTNVYYAYKLCLDAFLNSNHYNADQFSMRKDYLTGNLEVWSAYGKSYVIVDGGDASNFPAITTPAASKVCLIVKDGGLKFAFRRRAIEFAASIPGAGSLGEIIENPGSYIEMFDNALATQRGNYSMYRDFSTDGTSQQLLSMMMQGNFGGNALLNILSGVIQKLPYGTTDAMHYTYEVAAQAAIVRDNPALLRKWIVPDSAIPSLASASVKVQQTFGSTKKSLSS